MGGWYSSALHLQTNIRHARINVAYSMNTLNKFEYIVWASVYMISTSPPAAAAAVVFSICDVHARAKSNK